MPAIRHSLDLLAAVLVLAAAGSARAQTALERGEILVGERPVRGHDVPEVVVTGIINAAPAKVWDVVSHCAHYHRTMPRIAKSVEVSRKGNIVHCRVTVDVPFPYSDTTALTRIVHTEDPAKGIYKRVWKLVEGDYTVNEGSWSLAPYKGDMKRTLAVYRAIAKPKAWVPDWVRTTAQKSSLPKMFEGIRKQVGHR